MTIVTGGGKGIGRAIALAFIEAGARVILAARGRAELEEAAIPGQGLGGRRRDDLGVPTPSREAKRGAAHGEVSVQSLFVRGTAPGEGRLFLLGASVSANLPRRSFGESAKRGRRYSNEEIERTSAACGA